MADPLARLAAALTDRYAVEREVGVGGMATVYLAEDLKHHRRVALKVLSPDLAAAIGADRFLREIEISAGLHHPHILPLYDSGEADGLLYYVMPYVEGESLRARLDREKQLPIEDAVRLAREVADALSYAHGRGVVHRDIKPENILLAAGHAVVADFGIARAISAAGGESLTATGLAVGTPAYMSPEQAAADPEVDGRSDLYSLACTLFEMLAGQPPFTGPSPESVIRQHVMADPPAITAFRPAVPRGLAGTLARALAKTPADRFNPVALFAEALETPSAGRGPVLGEGRPSIAVLPFLNMSPDPENEYFSDGMTEEIISALSRLDGLRVASHTSAFSLKGKGLGIAQVGAHLGVAHVLEGSVRKAGDRIRVTAQLIRVEDDDHLWSDRFDSRLEDVFEVQERIARSIVDVLQVKLLGGERKELVVPATEDVRAYELFLRGRYCWNKRSEQGVTQGIGFFREAVALDPDYALAHVGLADAYNILGFYDLEPPREAFAQAKAAAERALALDGGLAEAHTSLGYVQFYHDWDREAAERSFRRAIELNPRYPVAHQFYANYLDQVGRLEEAELRWRTAHELDPLSLIVNSGLGWHFYFARRFEEAVAQLHRALELDDTFVPGRVWLGLALLQLQQWEEAIASFTTAVRASGESPAVVAELARAHAMAGDSDRARALVADLDRAAERRYVAPYELASVHLALGRPDLALTLLERAVEDRSHSLMFARMDPRFDPLREEPRFGAVLRAAGFLE